MRRASAKAKVPAATCAEYSPRLCPATNAGRIPRDSSSRNAATLTARIAGCAFSVSVSWSSGPSKIRRLRGSPSAASASANVPRQTGKASASARPMPAFWEPWPGKMQAIDRRLLFFDGAGLTAAIVAAVGTDAVRRLRLVAVRAFAQADWAEGIVRAALRRSRFRVSSFRIRHDVLSSLRVSFVLLLQPLQRGKPGIVPAAFARARRAIEIRPARRAQSAAVGLTQRLHRQRQVELLPHQLRQINLVVLVESGREIVLFDLPLAFAPVRRMRLIAQIEGRVDRQRKRLEAAAAGQFQLRSHRTRETDLLLRLVDVECQRDRRNHLKRVAIVAERRAEGIGRIDLLVTLVRRTHLAEIKTHESPNITRTDRVIGGLGVW